MAKAKIINAASAATPIPDDVPTVALDFGGDEPVEMTVRIYKGKPFISGNLHKEFSALVRETNAEIDAAGGDTKHIRELADRMGDEEAVTAYFAQHANELFNEMSALAARMNNEGGDRRESPEIADLRRRFIYRAVALALNKEGLDADTLAQLASDPDSPFWLNQNYDGLREWADWFRGRVGL